MNTSRVTFGMLNVAAASVLIANMYLFKTHVAHVSPSTASADLLPSKKATSLNTFTPVVYLDKINIIFPKKEELTPDLFKKQKDIITFNTNPTPGIVFRIQVLAAKTQVPLFSQEFKDLDNLREEYAGGIYKYTVGEFRTPDESERTFFDLEKKGYNDTFLVAYKDGKPINLRDAMASIKKVGVNN